MTDAEEAVWMMLRSRQIGGHRFRRQVPLGQYIVDFVCHEAQLVIEIDGGQHDHASGPETERIRFLEGEGYRVLRFWDNEVLENPEGAWMTISAALTGGHPHPTLPLEGGGLSRGQIGCEWRRFDELAPATLYEALRFRQAIFVVEQRCAYPDLDGLDQRAQHLLLRSDGILAGYLRLIVFPDEQRVAIGRVAVAAALRGHGRARLLMDEALARCRQDYQDYAVTLSAQTYLSQFYENLGFRATSAPYDDYGVSHVDMALR